MRRLNNRGDTIVEVLIAIAIVGMVLGGAYASANRSLRASQRAHERGEALRLAEQQFELLKVSGSQSNTIFTGNANFCLNNALAKQDFINGAPPANYLTDSYTTLPGGTYPTACRITYSTGSSLYHTWVSRLANDTFQISMRWDGSGGVKQELKISYRIRP